MIRRVLGCVGLLAVAACSAGSFEEGDPAASAASPIIKGTTSTSEQDAVVLLVMRSRGELRGLCTGTLVAPNLVLTARHCVSETDSKGACTVDGNPISGGRIYGDFEPREIDVYTGVDGVRGADDTSRADAHGAELVVESTSSFCNADVAFLVLDRSLPGRVAPMRLKEGAFVGESITAVGWGLTEKGTTPTRRMQRSGVAVQEVGPALFDAQSDFGLADSEFLVGEAFCSGDSGGPALSRSGAVVGVVARGGGGHETSNAASGCVGAYAMGIYTHLGRKSAQPRLETDGPGRGAGEACSEDFQCSSGVCLAGECAMRCDEGTKCDDGFECTPYEKKKSCTKAAEEPEPVAGETEEPAAAAPTTKTTVTKTTGCSTAPGSSAPDLGLLAGVGLALAIGRRRRR